MNKGKPETNVAPWETDQMGRRICESAVLVTGILILAAGFARSLLGWPAVSALLPGGVARDLQ